MPVQIESTTRSCDPGEAFERRQARPHLFISRQTAMIKPLRDLRSLLAGLAIIVTLTACGGGSGSGSATPSSAVALNVVATPNPNVFPLLVALASNPNLPVKLLPVASSGDAASDLAGGTADALLSMTYTAAQDVTSALVPDLELVSVNFWSGFWMVAPASANITQFSQLAGAGVLVSGPTSGGKGAGPDLIFQAAARRAGLSASSFQLCYVPVMQAAPMLLQQQAMNTNSACNGAYSSPPLAISLVEPAATGLVMDSTTSTTPSGALTKAINFQSLFTGYSAWPQSQLPHGGVSVRASALADSGKAGSVQAILSAYRSAADSIMAAKGNPAASMQIANVISAGITTYYGQFGLSLPAAAIAAALNNGGMVFRTDLAISAVQPDLSSFLTEVVGTAPPSSFFHPL